MKLLKIIHNNDLFPDLNKDPQIKYWAREAARAIVLDEEGNIASLYVPGKNYHKLPGGGIEGDETIEEGLRREIFEEVGCDIEILAEIGQINEYRDEHKMLQKNYCFLTKLRGKKGTPQFTAEELERGIELRWIPFDSIEQIIKNDKPFSEAGKFIKYRDKIFIEKAKRVIANFQ